MSSLIELPKKPDPIDWRGYVCAYVAFGGPFVNAYVGKVERIAGVDAELDPRHYVGKPIVLTDAFEFASITQIRGNQSARTVMGTPIEFTTADRIAVLPLAILVLTDLDDKAIETFNLARADALEKKKHLSRGAPQIQVAKNIPPGIVPGR